MNRFVVETDSDLWLVPAPDAAAAIAAVRAVDGMTEDATAAPLPTLRDGQPRRILFPEPTVPEPTEADEPPPHSE